jgi:hypothetical protein
MAYGNRPQRRYGGGGTPDSVDVEFTGRVDYVGAEPEFLSGRVPALQTVGMTVTEVRRGSGLSVDDVVDVDVMIYAGSPHIGLGQTGLPALDTSMVQPGVLLVAWANAAEDRWQAIEVSTDGPSDMNYAGRDRRLRR